MAVIFMLPRAFFKVDAYEDPEDLLIMVFIVAHDGCHFYAAESFSKMSLWRFRRFVDNGIYCRS